MAVEATEVKGETPEVADETPETNKESAADGGDDGKTESDSNSDTSKTSTETDDLERKIIMQIEYYFGDQNLTRDKFLKEQVKKDDGWVPLELLLKFNRLKALTTEVEKVLESLGKSESDLIEISECKTKIRRNAEKPLPVWNDEYRNELTEKSCHVKGFPLDTSLDDIQEFCAKYGKVLRVEMRKQRDKKTFKGCIFATYSSKEEVQALIALESLKFKDVELMKEDKTQYFQRKKEYNEKRKAKSKEGKKNKKQKTTA